MYAHIESDGELYKMQQEAIRRARETARRSMDYTAAPAPQYIPDAQPAANRPCSPPPEQPCPPPEPPCAPAEDGPRPPRARRELFRRPAVIDRLGMDNLLILAVLVILLMDGCSDTLLLIALAYLLLSDKF